MELNSEEELELVALIDSYSASSSTPKRAREEKSVSVVRAPSSKKKQTVLSIAATTPTPHPPPSFTYEAHEALEKAISAARAAQQLTSNDDEESLRRTDERARLLRNGVCSRALIEDIFTRSVRLDQTSYSFTEIARTAQYSDWLRDFLWDSLGYRPLPINRFVARLFTFRPPADLNPQKVVRTDAPPTAWIMKKWLVRVGEPIKKGQSLAQIVLVDLSNGNYPIRSEMIKSEVDSRIIDIHAAPSSQLMTDNLLITLEGTEVKLHSHQETALAFMKRIESLSTKDDYFRGDSTGGILVLEMGLGKTLTAITHSLLSPRPSYNTAHGSRGFPTLILTSKAVFPEWVRNGFQKFFDPKQVRVLFFDKDYLTAEKMQTITRLEIVNFDFVVVTYDTLAAVCKKGKFHECILEYNVAGKVSQVHARTRDQSDDVRVVGPGILFKTPWERVFADESTRFANYKTKTYQHIMALYGRFKYCLTGSPIVNWESDLWSQLRFCGYTGEPSAKEWTKKVESYMELHKINDHVLSIRTVDTEIVIPPLLREERRVLLDRENDMTYDYIRKVAKRTLDDVLSGAASYAGLLKLLTRLRQACIAPYIMLPEAKRPKNKRKRLSIGEKSVEQAKPEPDVVIMDMIDLVDSSDSKGESPLRTLQHLDSPVAHPSRVSANPAVVDEEEEIDDDLRHFFQGEMAVWVRDKRGTAGYKSPKISAAIDIIREVYKVDKIVVFSMFTTALDLLKEAIVDAIPDLQDVQNHSGIVQVDGSITGKKRERLLDQFRNDSKTRVLLMTTRVGSFGLDLTVGNHVVFLDLWWNDVAQRQAEAREHRPGQTKTVHSYVLLTEKPARTGKEDERKTVEDRILELCGQKKDMSTSVLEGVVNFKKKSLGLAQARALLN